MPLTDRLLIGHVRLRMARASPYKNDSVTHGARDIRPIQTPVTLDLLEKCLDRVALLIAENGDKGTVYLPIYDRLEAELRALKANEDRMARIRERVRR
jgi:hypothetical protein